MTAVFDGYDLSARYTRDDGRVFMTSIQALARIAPEQLRRDRRAGHRTAAFLSGYPGSPLGGFDFEVGRMTRHHPDLPIVHRPAVNEELGASAVMGSQLSASRPDALHDGVVGIWYGKAPGLDRATDAVRHGVFAGTSPLGGVVALVGDDPAAKSSTMPSSSDAALVDLHMPILYPGTTAECLELGMHAVAISRASGLWAAMKIVTPVADGSGTVDLPVLDADPIIPDGPALDRPDPSAMFLGSARMVAAEKDFRTVRSDAAQQYGIVNRLNRISVDPADAWIGLVATGYTYHEMREALHRLGFTDDESMRSAGIRLLNLRMPVPFDEDLVRRFARGLSEIVVVEEKNPTLEWLIKNALYDSADRPRIVGKHDPDGADLVPCHGLLDADRIVSALRARLAVRLSDRLAPEPPSARERTSIPLAVSRTPFFCSGCPHNWGTKVPEGSLVGAGTGCHGMSLLMPSDLVGETFGITAMGNEGAHWIGMEPFVETAHVFQNFGDGTYFHSGQLAIQAAIGSGVSITFKILYNSTVAMTGGQDPTFSVGVGELATILLAQGVREVVVTTPNPKTYDRTSLPDRVEIVDRTRIVEVQERLAGIPGVTVMINDQECAAELRRARKRDLVPTPTTRIVINHRICEGCGDCGDVSNCLSVQPFDTALGRKTRIDQASCNFDYSCVLGDCPAFMEVEASQIVTTHLEPPKVPDPAVPSIEGRVPIRLAGIGGTGVVTAAQVLATAAMFDGWAVAGLDQTGLSQKAGPVVSDLILTTRDDDGSNLIGEGEAATVVAFDQLVAAMDPVLAASDPTRTRVVTSTRSVPTGAMIGHPEIPFPAEQSMARLAEAATSVVSLDAEELCATLVGDVAPTNILILGVAVQLSLIPVTPASMRRAIELNGVAVGANLAAFDWGRAWASDRSAVEARMERQRLVAGDALTVPDLPRDLAGRVAAFPSAVSDVVGTLTGDLVAYQDRSYASRFLDTIERLLASAGGLARANELIEVAARSLHKLMAYKDEYEVARLMLLPEARAAAEAVGGPDPQIRYLLHPPMLESLGLSRKLRFSKASGPMFEALKRGKRLRGTALDPFGKTEMRRLERSLVVEFEDALTAISEGLGDRTIDDAIVIAGLPDMVRGYEQLKMRRASEYRSELARLLSSYAG